MPHANYWSAAAEALKMWRNVQSGIVMRHSQTINHGLFQTLKKFGSRLSKSNSFNHHQLKYSSHYPSIFCIVFVRIWNQKKSHFFNLTVSSSHRLYFFFFCNLYEDIFVRTIAAWICSSNSCEISMHITITIRPPAGILLCWACVKHN